jgi:hypothetical protein
MVEEIRFKWGFGFERFDSNENGNEENGNVEEHALLAGNLKGKCRNRGQIGHKLFQCKKKSNNNGRIKGTGKKYCSYYYKPRHVKNHKFKAIKVEVLWWVIV